MGLGKTTEASVAAIEGNFDSVLIICPASLKNNWKNSQKQPVKNIDLWKRLLAAKEKHQVSFVWVKGHAGHPENERCDQLATSAADGEDLLDDCVAE